MDAHYKTGMIVRVLNWTGKIFHSILSFLYSDVDQPTGDSRMKVTVCKIRTDKKTGSKYFYIRMRQYIYSEEENKYVPASCSVTKDTSIGSWLDGDW